MANRSLGTLTLDLVAKIGGFVAGMNKAQRESDKASKEIAKAWSNAGKVVGSFSAVANSGIVAYTLALSKSAAETQKFAEASNLGTTEFQRFSAAAKEFGFDQRAVAGVLSDVTKRVGEFLQTGGGPLKDFFETVAPQIGVTAKEFRNLSGPDALLKYVSSLEKANLGQEDFAFYMDKMSGKAVELVPLLKDGGARLKELGDRAEAAGVIMNEIEVAQLAEIDDNVKVLGEAFQGLSRDVAFAAIPAVNDLIKVLSDPTTLEAARALGTAIVSIMTSAVEAIKTTINVTKFLAEELASLGGVALDDVVRRLERIADLEKKIAIDQEKLQRPNSRTEHLLRIQLKERQEELALLKQQQAMYEELQKTAPTGTGAGTGNAAGGKPATVAGGDGKRITIKTSAELKAELKAEEEALKKEEKRREEQQKVLEEQQKAYNQLLLELRTEEEKINGTMRERLKTVEAISGLTKEQKDFAIGRIADQATEDAPDINKNNLEESSKELEEWYAQQLKMLETFREERADLKEYWDQEEGRIEAEHQKKLSEIAAEEEAERQKQLAKGYGVLLDAVGKYYEGMEGERAAYARAAISIGSALLDEEKRKSLQSIFTNTYDAAMKAYNSLASIPYIGPALGAAAFAGVVVAGTAAAAKVTGLAHDGIDSVPKDGTWLLEKGERVTTSQTSAKLDNTLSAVQAQLRQRNEAGGDGMGGIRIINAFEPSVVGDYLGSDEGERKIINVVRRNQRALQSD